MESLVLAFGASDLSRPYHEVLAYAKANGIARGDVDRYVRAVHVKDASGEGDPGIRAPLERMHVARVRVIGKDLCVAKDLFSQYVWMRETTDAETFLRELFLDGEIPRVVQASGTLADDLAVLCGTFSVGVLRVQEDNDAVLQAWIESEVERSSASTSDGRALQKASRDRDVSLLVYGLNRRVLVSEGGLTPTIVHKRSM
jgi:hypothetical protein